MGIMAGVGANEPPPILGSGELHRPRSASEGGGAMDRQRERQLVGSLTNSYKFRDGGLVKKVSEDNLFIKLKLTHSRRCP